MRAGEITVEKEKRSEGRSVERSGRNLPERLARREPDAPGEMIEAYYPELYRYARAILRDATLAEDVVHEAFVSALGALGKYETQRIRRLSIRAWLYRITSNKARDHLRKTSRLRESPLEDEPRSEPERDHAGVMTVLAALSKLPEKQRIAVTLRYLQDLPYVEIAAATGWPENTAKTLVRRGLTKLRTILDIPPKTKETK